MAAEWAAAWEAVGLAAAVWAVEWVALALAGEWEAAEWEAWAPAASGAAALAVPVAEWEIPASAVPAWAATTNPAELLISLAAAQQNGQNGMNGMQGNRAMNQFFTNMNKSMSRGKNQKGKSSNSENPPQPIRMEVKVAFDAPPVSANAVANVIQTRLTKILSDHHMSQPLITVQGDTAVITGEAKSDSERQTIGQLVSLESGIRAVRNEMTAPDAPPAAPNAGTPTQPGS